MLRRRQNVAAGARRKKLPKKVTSSNYDPKKEYTMHFSGLLTWTNCMRAPLVLKIATRTIKDCRRATMRNIRWYTRCFPCNKRLFSEQKRLIYYFSVYWLALCILIAIRVIAMVADCLHEIFDHEALRKIVVVRVSRLWTASLRQ